MTQKRPQKAETAIQREIKLALEALGYLVRRVHSGKARVRGGYLQLAESGTADLLVQGYGWTAWLEVKTEEGEQSSDQKEFAAGVRAQSNIYLTATSAAEAVAKLAVYGPARMPAHRWVG